MYGGTLLAGKEGVKIFGLSPCVRGNPAGVADAPAFQRTIPVCTGEPAMMRAEWRDGRDYPRVYGGTNVHVIGWMQVRGLSPCVRGNPAGRRTCPGASGTIPVCTGEPTAIACIESGNRDYPRVYGGTLGLTGAPAMI